MGLQPQDTGTIEKRFGFLKLNFTFRPFSARAYTVRRCLLLIFVLIVCLLTLKSIFFASGFRNQESGIGLSNNLETPGDSFLPIEDQNK